MYLKSMGEPDLIFRKTTNECDKLVPKPAMRSNRASNICVPHAI